jgi:dinuclear metal center YbgI/SA1388 family protein
MARRDDLIAEIDSLLEPAAFRDLGPNGLQVPGAEEVTRVVTGVSASRALIEAAIEHEAQLVLVHHGLFWDFHPTGLSPILAERLRLLFRHDVNLAAYHLPLDGHESVGNNAQLAERLGCASHEPFGEGFGRPIGRVGSFGAAGVAAGELFERVADVCGREPLVFDAGPERVRRIGIISGSAAKSLPEAIAAGLDAFLTGEPAEHVMADAHEAGIHFIAAGHYATETFGVRALGDRLASSFGVEHVFVDIPNPI